MLTTIHNDRMMEANNENHSLWIDDSTIVQHTAKEENTQRKKL